MLLQVRGKDFSENFLKKDNAKLCGDMVSLSRKQYGTQDGVQRF